MDSIEEKIRRIQAGEVSLFSDIIRLYQQRIYLYCFRLLNNKEEAEDAVQDVLIKAYQNIGQFATGLMRRGLNVFSPLF